MRKFSNITIGRLLNLKNHLFQYVKMGGGKTATAIFLASILFGGNAFAVDYIIDRTQTRSGTTYPSLDALRLASGIPTWNGDTITLKNDDATLAAVFLSGTPVANGKMSFSADQVALATAGKTQFDIDGSTQVMSNTSRFMNLTGANTATLNLNDIAVSKFSISNAGNVNGGAILTACSLTIEGNNISFVENSAGVGGVNNSGGAISTTGALNVTGNVTFSKNVAGGRGGAIYATNDLSLTGDTIEFSGNIAGNPAGPNFGGGAIYQNATTGSLTLGTATSTILFDKNISTGNGSTSGGGAISTNRDLAITGQSVTFSGNISAERGGAIANLGTGTITTIAGNVSFTGNAANGGFGGAFYTAGGASFIGTTEFIGNKATAISNANGGAVYLGAGKPTEFIGTTTFTKNEANASGGAVATANNSISTYSGYTTFTENKAGMNGGAINMGNGSTLNFITDSDNSFDRNKADRGGGAIYMGNGSTLNFTGSNSSFIGNEAGTVGGAIHCNLTALSFTGGINSFTGNKATENGGAIYTTGVITTDVGLTFTGNEAIGNNDNNGNGGAIHTTDSLSFLAGETDFDGNKAIGIGTSTGTGSCGGAIYSTTGSITAVGDMKFTNNTAGRSGGAIYTRSAIEATGNMEFSNNIASSEAGGAIYTTNNLSLTGDSIIFVDNHVYGINTGGGAIRQNYATGSLILGTATSTIEFKNNSTAGVGGAIYTDGILAITGQNVTFTDNEAGSRGGAIYTTGAIATTDNLTFTGNKAGEYGGAVYTTGTITTGNNWTFTDNTADGNGGAVYSNGILNINTQTIFDSNTATTGRGGAITMNRESGVLNVNATNFNQEFTGNNDSTGLNDIFLSNGATANFNVASGYYTYLEGGITDQFNGINQQKLIKNGAGALVFGAGSTSYLHGDVNINEGTIRLEYSNALGRGASFDYNTIYNAKVGKVTIADDVNVSYQFGSNGFDHSWIQGDTIKIEDGVKFDLDGVIWKPDARVICNLAEARFDENGGTIDVTLNLDRGSFMTGKNVADRSGQTNPNVSKWLFRDFTYYIDDDENFVKSYENGIHLGNIYAVELFKIDEVLGVDPPYVDPSLKNRILSWRLDRCCTSCSTTPTSPHWNAWVEGYGTGGSVGNYKGKNGFDFSTGGMLVGIEKETVDNHRLGFYYGYGSSWTTGRSISYNGKAENTFGGYLRIADELGYTLLMGSLGHNSYRSNRFINTGGGRETFNANFGANTSGAYLERGFDSRIASHTCLTPFAALQYSNLHTNWYDETVATGSDFRLAQTAKLGYDSLRTLAGVRTQTMLYDRLNWNNAIHWEHELTGDGAVVRDEYLTTNRTLNERTVGNYGGRDWVVYGTGLEFAVTPNMSLNAGYDLSFNKHSTFHTGMGGMTYTF